MMNELTLCYIIGNSVVISPSALAWPLQGLWRWRHRHNTYCGNISWGAHTNQTDTFSFIPLICHPSVEKAVFFLKPLLAN